MQRNSCASALPDPACDMLCLTRPFGPASLDPTLAVADGAEASVAIRAQPHGHGQVHRVYAVPVRNRVRPASARRDIQHPGRHAKGDGKWNTCVPRPCSDVPVLCYPPPPGTYSYLVRYPASQGLFNLTQETLASKLAGDAASGGLGLDRLLVEELVAGVQRINYGQDVATINALAGAVGLAGASKDLWAIQGGISQVCEGLLKKSGATVHWNTAIRVRARPPSPCPRGGGRSSAPGCSLSLPTSWSRHACP